MGGNKIFVNLHVNNNDIWKAINKNKRSIKSTKFSIFCLLGSCIFLALDLAERKRAENYLNKKIEKLEAKLGESEDNISDDPDDTDEDNGGAADA